MNDSDFEKHLQRQALRQVPQEWRADILRSAADSRRPSLVTRHSLLSTLNHHLSTLLWPNRPAWAALAAVWVLIFALRFVSRNNVPQMAKASSPHTQQIVMNLKEQQQILAELIGASAGPSELDRPKHSAPQPHSERRRATAMA